MATRLLAGKRGGLGFSSFVDVAINGMGAMFVFLVLYIAVVPPAPPPPRLRILTEQLPPAAWFHPYETGIQVTGGSGRYEFHIEHLEILNGLGLEVDLNSGSIGGVPIPPDEVIGECLLLPITVTVGDQSNQVAQRQFLVRILPATVPFDPQTQKLRFAKPGAELPEAWVGQSYRADLAILGGIEPYEVQCEGLPPGLQWQQGGIQGKVLPEAVAEGKNVQEYNVRLLVWDQQTWRPSWAGRPPAQLVGNFRLLVRRLPPLRYEGLYPAKARAGIAYRGFLVIRGGSGAFQIALPDGRSASLGDRLPLGESGLSVNCQTGEVTGIPRLALPGRQVQTFSFPFVIKDKSPLLEPLKIEVSLTLLPPMEFVRSEETP